MTLVHPESLWWGLLAIPITACYFVRIGERRYPVGATWLWQSILGRGAGGHRGRKLLSLGCQLAILALIVLAMAEPTFSHDAGAAQVVLIVDNSSSMNAPAPDGNLTRLDLARQRAAALVDALPRGGTMTVLSAGDLLTRHCGPTDHKPTLQAAIAGIPAAGGPTRIAQAVAVGRDVLSDSGGGRIIAITDAAFDGAKDLAAEPDVELLAVGRPIGNAAISRLAVRAVPSGDSPYEVLIELANYSDTAGDFTVALMQGDRVVQELSMSVPAGTTRSKVLAISLDADQPLVARLATDDVRPEDNEARVRIPMAGARRVLLVTSGNPILERALRSVPQVELEVATTAVHAGDAGRIVVYDRTSPNVVPRGPVLIVGPRSDTNLFRVAAPVRDAPVTSFEATSPLMSGVRLNEAYVPEVRPIEAPAPNDEQRPNVRSRVLATVGDRQPAIVEIPRKDGDVLVFGFEVAQGDLWRRDGFPRLIAGAIDRLAARRTTTTPSGERPSDEKQGGQLAADNAAAAGMTIAAIDTAESNLLPRVSHSPETSGRGSVWFTAILIVLAALLAGAEAVAYHRGRIV